MAHNKSYRTFIILQEDEKGHSMASDKPLTGYAKIETKNDKCKVSFYAQNLKKEYKDCYMMLICNKKDFKKNINLGPMNINQQGKAEMSLEYDSINIGDLNISYENIVGAAIGKNINGRTVFFMCGFLNNQMPKDNWKNYEIKMISGKEKSHYDKNNKEDEMKKECPINMKEDKEKYNDDKDYYKDKKDKDEKDKYKEYLKEKDKDYLKEENKEKECKKEYCKDKEDKEDKDDCKEHLKEEYKEKKDDCKGKDKEECKHHDKEEKHEDKCEDKKEDKCDKEDKYKKEDEYKDKYEVDDDCKDKHEEHKEYKDKDTDKDKHEEKKIEGYKDCYKEKYHRNDNWDYRSKLQECDRFISKIDLEREYDPYDGERYELGRRFAEYENEIEQMKLRDCKEKEEKTYEVDFDCPIGEVLMGALEGCKKVPKFAEDIKRCAWYKVDVRNFDDMCNMSNYNKYTMIYYPMINYYPYISKAGHFFFGVKCDKNGDIKYILYAIPGTKDRKDQPYGGRTGFVTWDRYGDRENGYWIMFYDFENSSVVIPMK
ncbi:hypothetical protein CYK89_03335 [Clostridium perfringens]|uniref:hypothetical protein n=1 Tax=Clostridium perfringens TaxID=1502 RepID=UPI000D70F085|nr:hypothetical protein [Clostridium perfringens]PWX41106.1 hypothetical protein CYK90_09130 [Clostridium perfringens]PWX56216.1 hypothetical protein CYK89_03335 [Clostridium perfringens]